jgi:NADH-quinone oxidoreductase subunit N
MLYAVFRLLLILSLNDLFSIFLAIEIQSIAFYLLASFKKESMYSVENGLKYFILGSVSSNFFFIWFLLSLWNSRVI